MNGFWTRKRKNVTEKGSRHYLVLNNGLDFGQNERVLGQKTRERENAKTGQRKELDTVSFSTMADLLNNSVL